MLIPFSNMNPSKRNKRNVTVCSQLESLLRSEWFLPFLFEYLEVAEIVQLDSLTRKWKECRGNDFSALSYRIQTYFINHGAIEWAAKRDIRFEVLHLMYIDGPELSSQRKHITINREGAISLSQLCTNLVELRLHFRHPFHIDKEFFSLLPTIGQHLEILDIQGDVPICENDLIAIGNSCRNLKEITLHIYGTNVTCIGINGLLKYASHLISFTSSGHGHAPLTLLLAEYCPLIEHVDIFYESEDDFELLTKTCKNLKWLSIWNYCAKSIVDADHLLQCLSENSVYLESFHVEIDGADFSMDGLKQLALNSSQLKSVEIMCLDEVCEETVKHFVSNCPLLEYFCFDSWKMTDNILKELGQCVTLIKMDLYRSNVTDEGIEWLLQTNRCFEDIDISNCELLSARSLFIIGTNCPELIHFDCQLGNNMNYSVEGFQHIMAKCAHLSDESLDTIQKLIDAI